jgi:hypothetical protein
MILPLIIAGIGVATAVAGVGLSVYGSSQQSQANQAAAQAQYRISQEQAAATRLQYSSTEELAQAQERLQQITRDQSQLRVKTERDVIALQRAQDEVRQLQNQITKNENQFKLEATKRQEGLNTQNDALNRQNENLQRGIFNLDLTKDDINRQNDALESRVEFIQGVQANLQHRRSQRDLIRQGVAARAQVQATSTARGQSGRDSGAQSQRFNVSSQERMQSFDQSQSFELDTILRTLNTQKRELGIQSREVGVNQRLLGEQQFELGTQARELGIRGRKEQYGVSLNAFEAQGQRLAANDTLFGLGSDISNVYLQSQDLNAGLVDQAYSANADLIARNKKATQTLLESQERVYKLGGNVSLANQAAASAGALAGLGMGLQNVGGMMTSNVGTFSRIGEYLTTPAASSGPTPASNAGYSSGF